MAGQVLEEDVVLFDVDAQLGGDFLGESEEEITDFGVLVSWEMSRGLSPGPGPGPGPGPWGWI